MGESDAVGSPGSRLYSDSPHVSVAVPCRKPIVHFFPDGLETGVRPAVLTSGNQSAFSDNIHAHRAHSNQRDAHSPGRRSVVRFHEMGCVVPGFPGFEHGSGRCSAMAVSRCA